MTTMREGEIIHIVNNNLSPDTLEVPLNAGEQAYYNSLIKEKEEFRKKNGFDVIFELPMEVYNDLW